MMFRWITIAGLFAALIALGACSTVYHPAADRPVNEAPPRAFATTIDSPDGSGNDSNERLTDDAVWWSAFADPVLDSAIQEGFRNNNGIKDVRGLIYDNYKDPAVPWNWWWPLQIGILPFAPAGYRHLDLIEAASQPYTIKYDTTNVDLSASYTLDLFGNLAEQRATGANVAEQQRQNVEASVQDLAMNIVASWHDILETRALRELTKTQIKYNQDLYELIKARFEQHLTPRLVVLQQEQLLVNLQSQLPLIDARIALLNSTLHRQLGRMPNPADDIVPQDRLLPDLPAKPGIGTPTDLEANTPEMRLAKLRLAEVDHRLNVNRSSYLPVIQLVGSIGLINEENRIAWANTSFREENLAVNITWTMFDGHLYTGKQQLTIQRRRREIQYDLALQTAVGRVQDALIREDRQVVSLQSLREQVELGRKLLDEARRLFEQGQSDYLPVLTALNNQVDLERAALQAQRLLLAERVELYRSLGGNWSYDATKERRE